MNIKLLSSVAIVAATLAVSACASTPSQRSAGEVVDDGVLNARVKAALIDNEATKARQIDVTVNRGVVELAGTVDTAAAKSSAATVTRNVEGVRDVRNNLMVTTGDRSVGDVIDDASLTARVKAALIGNPATQARSIQVSTREGVVQLHGFVNSQAEANEATREARAIAGVKSVRNDLEIQPKN